MFQTWQGVKVTNEESAHFGKAGTVMRTEKRGDLQLVQVRLDLDGTTEPFDVSELMAL